jgi:hypothetical protein
LGGVALSFGEEDEESDEDDCDGGTMEDGAVEEEDAEDTAQDRN